MKEQMEKKKAAKAAKRLRKMKVKTPVFISKSINRLFRLA
jgi:hypothetical protein